jgi:hypothetical protein
MFGIQAKKDRLPHAAFVNDDGQAVSPVLFVI